MANRAFLTFFTALTLSSVMAAPHAAGNNGNTAYPLLRLKLVLNAFSSDDIAIAFNSSATVQYNNQLDSRYLPGINAPEGLAALSSDNVRLSAYVTPLPGKNPLVIRLDIEAANAGPFTLEKTWLDSIPPVYDIWLVDKYTKDSLNLRTNSSYALNIDKNDTASFGSNRLQVVIRQNQALMFHLLGFTGARATVGNNLSWTTENEQNNTDFMVERSIDDGAAFYELDSLTSNSSGAYSYADKTPVDGTDLYRLKTRDANGIISYSNIVSISTAITNTVTKENNISIYPNPSGGMIHITIKPGDNDAYLGSRATQTGAAPLSLGAPLTHGPSSYAIKIININGTVVKTATSPSASWQDNLGYLAPGTYIVQVINNRDNSVAGKNTFIKL